MASPEKRCLYEVLGLNRDCSADEIRSAYKKLALQRHPDKLVQSGLSQAEATASFQELVNAYEVLSDTRERAWYDSHRSQILFSDSAASNSSTIPNLFSFFSNSVFSGYSDIGKGFYRVYADVFDKIYACELNFANKLGLGLGAVKEMPVMGNLDSPYAQVTAFYNFWLGFATVMDFCWVDQYDVMAGPNRKSRRVMEEENKKLRKKARREYNETVRGLAEFVKKRDKRVIDMQLKKSEEMEKKREEERKRKKELERERLERARAYVEPEWSKVEEDEEIEDGGGIEDEKKNDGKELYCVVCSKKFKSEKQWKNHEQSKKHKEKVAEFREFLSDEKRGEEEPENVEEEVAGGNGDEDGASESGFASVDDGVDELREQLDGAFGFQEQESDDDEAQSSKDEEFIDINNGGGFDGIDESLGSDDDEEMSILQKMVSGHKSRKNAASVQKPKAKASQTKDLLENDNDEADFEFNNRKSTRRNRGSRKGRGKRTDEEATRAETAEINGETREKNGHDNGLHVEASAHSSPENQSNGKGDYILERNHKVAKHSIGKKSATKRETSSKSKNSSKGRKEKATSKTSSNVCETCGEDFESRNKLHKHLGDTGHASLKYR